MREAASKAVVVSSLLSTLYFSTFSAAGRAEQFGTEWNTFLRLRWPGGVEKGV